MAFRMLRESAIELVILVIIVSLGITMLGSSKGLMSTQTVSSAEYNATNTGLYALIGYTNWYQLIVVAIIFVALIGIIYLVHGAVSGGTTA